MLAALTLALLMYLTRAVGFYYDEWNFVLDRSGNAPGVFLRPHNEHISIVPVLIYKALIAIFGLNHHWPFMAALAAMHVGLGCAVYALARPRVGASPALVVATLVLFMGLAWQNMVWAFQIGFVGSVLGGVLAWLALDGRRRFSEPLACLALLFSIGSSSLGVPMAIGVGAELLVARRPRSLWVVGVPIALYLVWYLRYGVSTLRAEGVLHLAPWAAAAVAAGAGALVGLPSSWGVVIAVGASWPRWVGGWRSRHRHPSSWAFSPPASRSGR